MEGAMSRPDCDDENPIQLPDPDPLTAIFEWIESDGDALEDAPQELTALYPDPPG